MLYFANPSTPTIRNAMTAGKLGCILTPRQRQTPPPGAVWCADNGAFGKGYPGPVAWWEWLASLPHRERCRFAVAPDVVADAAATRQMSEPWLPRIRELGLPAAYVAQDGITATPPPWADLDVLFLGGSDAFKLGPEGRAAALEATDRGKLVHMGRVSSLKRTRYAAAIGCTTVDGTFIRFGPDRRLPEVLSWCVEVAEQTTLPVGVT